MEEKGDNMAQKSVIGAGLEGFEVMVLLYYKYVCGIFFSEFPLQSGVQAIAIFQQ